MLVIQYDTKKYPFQDLITKHLGFPLHQLHQKVLATPAIPQNDQDTQLHRMVYQDLATTFLPVYHEFARFVIQGLEGGPFAFQAIPTFRFQLPGGTGTKEFHRDRDYHHPPTTLNVIIPLTPMGKTASVMVQAAPHVPVMQPMTAVPGMAIFFDGANTLHGSVRNEEDFTRVSFDFRILPVADILTDRLTLSARIPLTLGAYYLDGTPPAI